MRSLDPRDAALTGCGWASSVGYGAASVWAALLAGRRGVRVVGAIDDPPGLQLAAPAERPLLRAPVPEEQESQAKFLNAAGELAATVVREALEGAIHLFFYSNRPKIYPYRLAHWSRFFRKLK